MPVILALLLTLVAAVAYKVATFTSAAGVSSDLLESQPDSLGETLVISLATSVIGGAVAAVMTTALQARRERVRWRAVKYVGASALMGRAMVLSDLVLQRLKSSDGDDLPEQVSDLSDFQRLESKWLRSPLVSFDVEVAQSGAEFAEQALAIVSSTPGLRDDPLLMREAIQSIQYLRDWPAITARTNELIEAGAGEASPQLYLRFNMYRQMIIQLLRAVFIACPGHMDPKIGAAADREFGELVSSVENAFDEVTDESGRGEAVGGDAVGHRD